MTSRAKRIRRPVEVTLDAGLLSSLDAIVADNVKEGRLVSRSEVIEIMLRIAMRHLPTRTPHE